MKAGRELDALIAEKVMGFDGQHVDDTEGWCEYCGQEMLEYSQMHWDQNEWLQRLHPRPVFVTCQGKHYSTNIADAWEVVRKIGMVLIENSGEVFGKLDEWNVQFVGHDKEGEPHWVSESAETVELAICLAALKAKGVTGEQHG